MPPLTFGKSVPLQAPWQDTLALVRFIIGLSTSTTTLAVFEQPLPSVPVTVYAVVVVGEALTTVPDEEFKVAAGLHT